MQMGTLDMDTIRFGGRVYSVCFVVVGVPCADGHAGHGHHKVWRARVFCVFRCCRSAWCRWARWTWTP